MLEIKTHNQDQNLTGCVDIDDEEIHSRWEAPWERIIDILGQPEHEHNGGSTWWIRAESEEDGVGFFALRMDCEKFYLTGDVRYSIVRELERTLREGLRTRTTPRLSLCVGSQTKLPLPDRRMV